MRPELLYSIILSLVAFPLTPKFYMSFNGLEIMNVHFSYSFAITNSVSAEMCDSGVADRDPQNIWNP